MAVCYATAVLPKKGKNTRGAENFKNKPLFGVDLMMGGQKWTTIKEVGVLLQNSHSQCIFSFFGSNRRSITHGQRRKVR